MTSRSFVFSALLGLSCACLLPRQARASQCAEGLELLEPTKIEIVVTPPVDCLTVEAISSGCGDAVAVRIENDCAETATVTGDVEDCSETPCEIEPGSRFFIEVDETQGHVEIAFSVAVGDANSDVTAAFDVEAQEPDSSNTDSGCSASSAPGRSWSWLPAALAVLLLRRRPVRAAA